MIKPKVQHFILGFTMFLFITACNQNKRSINTKGISIPSQLIRFDQLLSQDAEISQEQIDEFSAENPNFSRAFEQAILGQGEELNVEQLNQFKTYFDTIGIHQLIEEEYGKFNSYFNDITELQKRLQVAVPSFKPVNVITTNTGFNYKNFLVDNAIAIGLEMYLGKEVDYFEMGSQFPEYRVQTFTKNYIVPDVADALVNDLFPDRPENNTLLDKMIYYGKAIWLKSLLLPKTEDHYFINYTSENYKWAKENEREIWRFFVSKELLYNNNFNDYKTYVTAGPFSSGMPPESPANTGSFIGYQIVKQYAKNHPELSILEIMQNANSQEILNNSQYRP